MELEVLVDGYNVIKNNSMFQAIETKSLADARAILIKQLKNRYRQTTHRVIVVFDGDGAKEQVRHDDHIRIIFSRYGETADSVIARLAAEARQCGQKVVSYSDDCEVQDSVSAQGGSVQTTHQLTTTLNAAPRDIAIRTMHRLEMRRVYGLDPAHKAVDEEEPPPHHPHKKKKKSARHHK